MSTKLKWGSPNEAFGDPELTLKKIEEKRQEMSESREKISCQGPGL